MNDLEAVPLGRACQNLRTGELDGDVTEQTRIATNQMRVTAIRARGDTFYRVSAESSELTRFDDGETSTTSADTCNPGDFVLDGDRAIVLATGSACAGILSVPLAGGTVTPIAQHSGWKPIFGNLVGGTFVWTNFLQGTAGVMSTDVKTGETKRLTGEGKAVYALATAFDGEHVYFSTHDQSNWVSEGFEGGFFYAMSTTGTEPVLISNIKASVLAIAVRDDLIAWTHDGPRRQDAPAGTDLTWRGEAHVQPELNEDFVDLLRALLAAKVDFVIVGAHALAAHGLPRATGDLDVLARPTADSAPRG